MNEAVARWLADNDAKLVAFYDTWERLEGEGKVDAVGGGEFRTIFQEWVSEGCPDDVACYIDFTQSRKLSLILAGNSLPTASVAV